MKNKAKWIQRQQEIVSAAPAAGTDAIPNRQAMIAAIAVAVAEEMGTDPAGIRILSIKKL